MSLSPEFKRDAAYLYAFGSLFVDALLGIPLVTSLKNVPESTHVFVNSAAILLAVSGISAAAYSLYLQRKHNVW